MELQGGAMARGDRNSEMYESVTRGIRVSVSPRFLEDQSDPEEPRYVWAYTVRINNESDTAVRLRTRYWRITDSRGQTDIVAGDGVAGEAVQGEGDDARPVGGEVAVEELDQATLTLFVDRIFPV